MLRGRQVRNPEDIVQQMSEDIVWQTLMSEDAERYSMKGTVEQAGSSCSESWQTSPTRAMAQQVALPAAALLAACYHPTGVT